MNNVSKNTKHNISSLSTPKAGKLFYVLFLILNSQFFILNSCDTSEPPPPSQIDKVENTIQLSLEWRDLNAIKIRFTKSALDTNSTYSYFLSVNGKEEKVFNSLLGDTAYTQSELSEGVKFSYKVEAYEETELKDTSQTLQTETLSTTNHEIEWKVDTLGQRGNFLNDVWGLDENNVWAVGYVELAEGSSGIIKWNGSNWSPFPSDRGVKSGIFGFDFNNLIYVGESSNRGIIGRWNGVNWTLYDGDYFKSQGNTVYPLKAVWGSSPEDVWAVGDRGTIVHWDGVEWKKVESPVNDQVLTDIYGTSANNIYAVAFSLTYQSKIIHYNGIKWIHITNQLPEPPGNLISLWIDKTGKGFVTGGWELEYDNGIWSRIETGTTAAVNKIRGLNNTDVVLVGQESIVHHHNGASWERYKELEDRDLFVELKSVAVFENRIFCVGETLAGAKVIIGKRN